MGADAQTDTYLQSKIIGLSCNGLCVTILKVDIHLYETDECSTRN